MADWETISALGTAGGTLVLAVATFASVRSANRAARISERGLLESIRPVLAVSRADDAPEKVGFVDDHFLRLTGGQARIETSPDVIYLAAAVRNAGTGILVLRGWSVNADGIDTTRPCPPLTDFRETTRSLYLAPADTGFWQGAIRNPDDPADEPVRRAVKDRIPIEIDLLYSDVNGGQRMITRLNLRPVRDNDAYLLGVSRHWHVDGGPVHGLRLHR